MADTNEIVAKALGYGIPALSVIIGGVSSAYGSPAGAGLIAGGAAGLAVQASKDLKGTSGDSPKSGATSSTAKPIDDLADRLNRGESIPAPLLGADGKPYPVKPTKEVNP